MTCMCGNKQYNIIALILLYSTYINLVSDDEKERSPSPPVPSPLTPADRLKITLMCMLVFAVAHA